MQSEVTPREQALIMAVAMLDGWGEQAERVALPIHEAQLQQLAAQGVTLPESAWPQGVRHYERYKHLNPPEDATSDAEQIDVEAMEQWGKRMAGLL